MKAVGREMKKESSFQFEMGIQKKGFFNHENTIEKMEHKQLLSNIWPNRKDEE